MASLEFPGFEPSLFKFLRDLRRNNNRPWFQKNKDRYGSDVREPCLAFIRSLEPYLRKISPFFQAQASRTGGSLMRIHRDTRFSKNKYPYKTNVGIHFRHELGRDVHAPGFYVHIAGNECFLGVGVWRPDLAALGMIRAAIDHEPSKWKRARDGKKFRTSFDLAGDSLKTAPRGYDKDHPLIDDLRRTDFIAVQPLTADNVVDKQFLNSVASSFSTSRSFMRFLCEALQVPF